MTDAAPAAADAAWRPSDLFNPFRRLLKPSPAPVTREAAVEK